MIKKLLFICFIFGLSALFVLKKAQQEPAGSAPNDLLIVGTNAEFPPFSFVEKDTIVGFDIDLIKEIATRLNKKVEFKDMPFDALIPAAQLGAIQVIAAGITATPERAKNIIFTKPYLHGDQIVIISKAHTLTPIKNVTDLIGKTVIVNEGFTADSYISQINGIHLIRLPTVADAFVALQAGQASAFVIYHNAAQPFFTLYGKNTFQEIPINDPALESFSAVSLGISKKHATLLPTIQQVIDTLESEGFIDQLKKKWQLS